MELFHPPYENPAKVQIREISLIQLRKMFSPDVFPSRIISNSERYANQSRELLLRDERLPVALLPLHCLL